jgi:hypothetical protein
VGVFFREVLRDAVQDIPGVSRQGGDLRDTGMVCEGPQPTDLYEHPVSDQAELAEDGAKILRLRSIASVDRGDRGEGR